MKRNKTTEQMSDLNSQWRGLLIRVTGRVIDRPLVAFFGAVGVTVPLFLLIFCVFIISRQFSFLFLVRVRISRIGLLRARARWPHHSSRSVHPFYLSPHQFSVPPVAQLCFDIVSKFSERGFQNSQSCIKQSIPESAPACTGVFSGGALGAP